MNNNTLRLEVSQAQMSDVFNILSVPILEVVKPAILKRLLKYDGDTISLDAIKSKITTQQLKDLLALGIVVDRVWYWLELNPAIAENNVPSLFPQRTIATEWDEDGNVTVTRVLKINEYFYNETHDGRFFIRLSKAPIDANGCIKAEDLPDSQQVADVISEFGASILNHYSSGDFNELRGNLNEEA